MLGSLTITFNAKNEATIKSDKRLKEMILAERRLAADAADYHLWQFEPLQSVGNLLRVVFERVNEDGWACVHGIPRRDALTLHPLNLLYYANGLRLP